MECKFVHETKIVSEYDQEIPQSQTADNPVAEPLNHHETPGRQIRGIHYTSSILTPRIPKYRRLRGERQTFKWFLKRAESETPCKLILVAE